jgi:hypothetical protein
MDAGLWFPLDQALIFLLFKEKENEVLVHGHESPLTASFSSSPFLFIRKRKEETKSLSTSGPLTHLCFGFLLLRTENSKGEGRTEIEMPVKDSFLV